MGNRLVAAMARLAPLLVALTPACERSRLSDEECNALGNKYKDLWGREDSAMKSMSAADWNAKKLELAKTDSDLQQVLECQNAITRHEYECAIKADSKKAWNACID